MGHEPALGCADGLHGSGAHGFQIREADGIHGLLALGVIKGLGGQLVGVEAPRAQPSAALDDGSGHEVPGEGRDEECLHAHGTGALAEDGDMLRVSAKGLDVVLDPLQSGNLVHEAIVSALALFGREFRMAQEAQRAQAVIDGYEDDSPLGPLVSVHGHFIPIAVHEGSAVNPQSHWKLGFGPAHSAFRCPYIQVQAVLAFFRCALPVELVPVESAGLVAGLGSNGAEGVAQLHAFPGLDRLRCLPAEVAYGRSRIGNAFVHHHAGGFAGNTLELASIHGNHIVLLGAGGRQQQEGKDQSLHFTYF